MLPHSCLRSLSVNHNAIAGEAAAHLASVAVAESSLVRFGGLPIDRLRSNDVEEIDLKDENLGIPEATLLCHLLRSGAARSLRTLNLDGFPVPISDLKGMRPYVQSGAPEVIDLQGCKLGLASFVVVGHLLSSNTVLQSLILDDNPLGAEGAEKIADGLRVNQSLTLLSLCNSNLGVQGAMKIAKALQSNTSLATLRLGDNKIGGHDNWSSCATQRTVSSLEGPAAIALALARNRTLTELSLNGNALRAEGAAKVVLPLQSENRTLLSLSLDDNELKKHGAAAITEMLKVNSTLTTLSVASNGIDMVETRRLIEAAGERVAVRLDFERAAVRTGASEDEVEGPAG